MKPTSKFVYIVLFLSTLFYNISFADSRQIYNFNSDWKLKIGNITKAKDIDFNDSDWKTVTLPRAFNEDEAFRVHIEQLTDTIVWYRKHFKIPSVTENQKIFIEFEGVRFGAEVYVNGQYVGIHENGVMAFGFDLTPFIFPGADNVIAVRVDNSWNYHEKATGSTFQWNNKNFNANRLLFAPIKFEVWTFFLL